jgi:hypothetical protein
MSTSRAPLVAPSLADTLPNINFGFDELRDRMAKFTAKFDAFIEQGRKRVLEERNQFRMNVAELQGKQVQLFSFLPHRRRERLIRKTNLRRGPAHEEKGH